MGKTSPRCKTAIRGPIHSCICYLFSAVRVVALYCQFEVVVLGVPILATVSTLAFSPLCIRPCLFGCEPFNCFRNSLWNVGNDGHSVVH